LAKESSKIKIYIALGKLAVCQNKAATRYCGGKNIHHKTKTKILYYVQKRIKGS